MKYIIETNAYDGSSYYSQEFDTLEKAIEEMAYEWRLLPNHTKSELRRWNYLTKNGKLPYMIILGGMTTTTCGIFTYTEAAETMTLREMIAAKERDEEEQENEDFAIEEAINEFWADTLAYIDIHPEDAEVEEVEE